MDENFFDDPIFGEEEDRFGEDLEDIPERRKGLYALSTVDYNLDSPLVLDKVYHFWLFIRGLKYSKLFDQGNFTFQEKILSNQGVSKREVRNPKEFHKYVGRFLRRLVPVSGDWGDVMSDSFKGSNLTSSICDSFLKSLGNFKSVNPSFFSSPLLKQYGTKFLDWYKVVLAMNNCNCIRGKNLEKVTGLTFHNKEKHEKPYCTRHFFTGNMGSIGRLIICQDFVYLISEQELLGREAVLMIKDVLAGRVNCLMSLELEEESFYKLEKWFKEGDKVLEKYGNESYKVFKIIEPICNNTMSNIGSELVPDFPKFEDFPNFIRGETITLIRDYPEARDFLQLTQDSDLRTSLNFYGCYRSFGHPVIDYIGGLADLYELTHSEKTINEGFVDTLASDLTFMVLEKKFKEDKKWYLDVTRLPPIHPLYPYVSEGSWPPPRVLSQVGDFWHHLPIKKCFEIPDFIDPSELYSDKSHSIGYSELLHHLETDNTKPIPTRRVLISLLENKDTNWTEFLQRVNDTGFTTEELIIGLRAKERELKIKGRFFALMSWKLREYFVITEWLIKHHFIPLFEGLTMADDMNTVITKMINKTSGQDGRTCDSIITICNHLDYEKWNNNQRGKSNNPIFRVMGQFLGYPKLIERTHEIFEKSFVYFANRPDLMKVEGGRILNNSDDVVCWEGQLGGLEGLRQKGWTISSMLMLLRIPKTRNTLVRTLAQGDNQIVVTSYKPKGFSDDTEKRFIYNEVFTNNKRIMDEVRLGATMMGLNIKEEECMQSIGYLNYGKIVIIKGVIYPVTTKRVSRINALSNDQLPTMGNVLSTVGSNILTISHFHPNIYIGIKLYNFFINYSRRVWEIYDCILGDRPGNIMKVVDQFEYVNKIAFQDPSLGGIAGTSLSRFLIRGFPDPVTEGLSFWKLIHETSIKREVKELAIKMGNPRVARFHRGNFRKLLENPSSLNLISGLSPAILLRDEIKKGLQRDCAKYQNQVIKASILYGATEEEKLIDWLMSHRNWYPKFQSEFFSSTFMGIVESHVNMFQNARTIRNCMKKQIELEFNCILIKCETDNIKAVSSQSPKSYHQIWICSASQADHLRMSSWGRKIYGITIPHPLEMLGNSELGGLCCKRCEKSPSPYISTIVPQGFPESGERGPFKSYLGSKTRESTSLTNPWEKETKIPLIRRASHLRVSIGWFVPEGGPVAKTIFNNLKSLTDEDWGTNQVKNYKRTGTAQHRYGCSRQSQGGYCAQNPCLSSHMITTTDTLGEWAGKNYDFMFQATILFCQLLTYTKFSHMTEGFTVHHHFKCTRCIREIEEIEISCLNEMDFPNVSRTIKGWMTSETEISTMRETIVIDSIEPTEFSTEDINFQVGFTTGFLFSSTTLDRSAQHDDSALFPLAIKDKILAKNYLEGMLIGMLCVSGMHIVSVRILLNKGSTKYMVQGVASYLISKISNSESFQALSRDGALQRFIETLPHKIPGTYPMSNWDLGVIMDSGMKMMCQELLNRIYRDRKTSLTNILIFPETNDSTIISKIGLSVQLLNLLLEQEVPSKDMKSKIKVIKEMYCNLSEGNIPKEWILGKTRLRSISQEIRYVLRTVPRIQTDSVKVLMFGAEYVPEVSLCEISGTTQKPEAIDLKVPKLKNILISSLRTVQIATGSHYKIRGIIKSLNFLVLDALCGGDGSGGIGASILRDNATCRIIFNSLMELDRADLKGSKPNPPSAIDCLGSIKTRCVNLYDVWEHSSDLSHKNTWAYFLDVKRKHRMTVNLITLDMQVVCEETQDEIDDLFVKFSPFLLEKRCLVIYKTYVHRLCKKENLVTKAWKLFGKVSLARTSLTSSHSSEIYVIFENLSGKGKNHYPDLAGSTYWLKDSFCFKSVEEEYTRARAFVGKDLTVGVPKSLVSNPEIDLSQILQILGVSNRASIIVARRASENISKRPVEVVDFICSVSGKFIYNAVTSEKAPSNTEVENIILLHIGLWTYYSLISGDIEIHKLLNVWINLYGWLYYDVNKGWSFFKGKRCKTVKVESRISLSQHLARSLFKMHNTRSGKYSLATSESFIKSFTKGWSLNWIRKTSGSLDRDGPWRMPQYITYMGEVEQEKEICYQD
ncbi:L protein [Hainan black-spectacled toad rhabdovirus]|uniref:Replicase n=1 Tax=Hainan black-spectacled toad rhabdovirus TaxID=2847103 RepID=A0A2P1GMS5_9RHAB|nr:L protein [Hainan black-spectacled toad rhabdovirus]AVM87303.1 L protein [Hainan black-spectacled toad rhabdovirus]